MTDLFEEEAAPAPKAEKPAKGKKAAKAKPPEPVLDDDAEPAAGSVEARTELIVSEARADPVALFTDQKRYSEFYEKIKAQVSAHEPDVSTPKGRAAIKSLAFRVTKAKTALDKAGLGLTKGWRDQIALVNESRSKMVEELDELAAETRAPLTAWEEAETARNATIDAELEYFRAAMIVPDDATAAHVERAGRELAERPLAAEIFQDRLAEAEEAKDTACRMLAQTMFRLRKAEAEAAELEQLRAEKAARELREQQEGEARELASVAVDCQRNLDAAAETVDSSLIAQLIGEEGLPADLAPILAEAAAPLWRDHLDARAEAQRRAEEEARAAEARRAEELRKATEEAAEKARKEAAEAAQAEREEQERQRAAEAEAAEAERQRVQDERDRAAQAELDAANARAREAEAMAEREREERAQAERERAAQTEAAAARAREAEAEELKRQRNKAHRKAIAAESAADLEELIAAGPDGEEGTELAQRIVIAIAAQTVRHLSIEF